MNWSSKSNILAILAASFVLVIPASAAFAQGSSQSRVVVNKVNFEYGVALADAPMQTVAAIFENRIFQASQLADEAAEVVRNVFQQYGYLDANVDRPSLTAALAQPDQSSVDLRFRVHPGSEYRLGEVLILNSKTFVADELRELIPLHLGDVFSMKQMRAGLADLRQFYRCRGYIQFSAVPSVEHDYVAHTVRVTIDVNEGETYTLHSVQVLGLDEVLATGLRNSPHLQIGRRYSPCELEQVFQDLQPIFSIDGTTRDILRATLNDDTRTVDLVFDFRGSKREPSNTAPQTDSSARVNSMPQMP